MKRRTAIVSWVKHSDITMYVLCWDLPSLST